MTLRRALALPSAAVAVVALAGCFPQPPAAAPPGTTEPATQAPATSAPSSSAPSTPDATGSAQQTGSSVSIDGQDVGSWGGTLSCLLFDGTALITSSGDDESGSLVGTASDETGAWLSAGFLLSNGSESYFQQDETSPATLDGSTFSTEFVATTISGGTATVSLTVDCS